MRRMVVAGCIGVGLFAGAAACGDQQPDQVGTASEGSRDAEVQVGHQSASAWIVERSQADELEASDEGPREEGPDEQTRALLAEFQSAAGEGFEPGSLGRYVLPDGSVAHFGQLVRGIERLSFTTQQLVDPLAIIPEEGSPLRTMGEYWQEAEGPEVLVVDMHRALGTTSRSDRQVYVVESSGRMTEIGYRLVVEQEVGGDAERQDWLVELGRAINRSKELGT